MAELTTKEREFVIWALGFIEGTALEMHDDKTGQQANAIAEKLKSGASPADTGSPDPTN